jgi:hypothetical protein
MKGTFSVFTIAMMLVAMQPARAEFKPSEAKITYMKGKVEVQRKGSESMVPAAMKMTVYPGDMVSTDDGSEAELKLSDGSILKLRDKSKLEIERMEKQKKPVTTINSFKLASGKILGSIRKLSSKNSKFTVSTPTAVAGIRGTVFGVFVEGDSTELDVLNGEVAVQGDTGPEVMVKEKMTTTICKGDSARNPIAMTAAKIAFITMWAGAAIKIGSMGTAAATAWYATTPAIVGGAAAVVATTAAVIIISGGEEEQPAPTPAQTIPNPPGWPGQ